MARVRSATFVLALVAASCSASYPTKAPDPTLIAVHVLYSQPMSYPAVGSSYSFTAYGVQADGGWVDVTNLAQWSSSDSRIVRPVGSPGVFTAVAAGQAHVAAHYQSTVATLPIAVIRPELLSYPRLSVSGGYSVTAGTQVQLYLSLLNSPTSSVFVTSAATWTSADPSVVAVDRGWLTVVRAGTTVITATYNGLTVDYGLSVHPRK